jgi:hypothetical protein
MPGTGLKLLTIQKDTLESQPSSRTGENPSYGMIGRIEETSASFEARSAPRSYPTPISELAVRQGTQVKVREWLLNRCSLPASSSCWRRQQPDDYFQAASTKLGSKNLDIGGTGCLRSPHSTSAPVILL